MVEVNGCGLLVIGKWGWWACQRSDGRHSWRCAGLACLAVGGLRLAYLAGWLSLIMTVVSAFGFVRWG